MWIPASRSAMGVSAVFLVGFMAAGKTSVGQELARRLGWEFVDLDTRIEHRERQSVPEIFQSRGEPSFRAAETAALRDLTARLERDSVVALGGGAFVQEMNRELLRDWPSVFLEAPVDELWRRCSEDSAERPLRNSLDQFNLLYQQRLPFYRQAAVVVDTSAKDISSICSEIENALQLTGVTASGSPSLSSVHPMKQPGESR